MLILQAVKCWYKMPKCSMLLCFCSANRAFVHQGFMFMCLGTSSVMINFVFHSLVLSVVLHMCKSASCLCGRGSVGERTIVRCACMQRPTLTVIFDCPGSLSRSLCMPTRERDSYSVTLAVVHHHKSYMLGQMHADRDTNGALLTPCSLLRPIQATQLRKASQLASPLAAAK